MQQCSRLTAVTQQAVVRHPGSSSDPSVPATAATPPSTCSLQSSSFDDCVVKCAANPACEFATYGDQWKTCWLKHSPGSGPDGVNAYNPALKTGVAIQRVKTDRANFQWAKGPDVELPGKLIPIKGSSTGYELPHSNVDGKRNLALCAVACMTLQGCSHVAYTDTHCYFKDASGPAQAVPSSGGPVKGTLVNMSTWNWDKKP